MGDLHEIIDAPTIDRISLVLAIVLPLLFCAIGAILGARNSAAPRGARIGLTWGMLGPANLILWRLYNVITDHIGLDTVANVFVNMALFVFIGVAVGLVIRRAAARRT